MRNRDGQGRFKPFSLIACKLNFSTGEGGGRLHIKRAIIHKQKRKKGVKRQTHKRMPNHEENGTLNIELILSGEIRTIHVRLIEKLNGMTIYD